MKINKLIFLVLILFNFTFNNAYPQGCSDAGFCTVASLKPNGTDSATTLGNQFTTGIFFGKADHNIAVYGSYIEYTKQTSKMLGFNIKLTTLGQNGNNISVFGFSDVFLSTTYKTPKNIKLTAGVKVPLSNANKMLSNVSLPMDYQASLGTLDVIFGLGYNINKLQLTVALQQPLIQNNNQFLASYYPISSKIRSFQPTNKFKRSGDILIRVAYQAYRSSKIKLSPSILPIYHLKNDTYINEFNKVTEIRGSQGLTLNGNIYFDYKINNKNLIQLNVSAPLIVRKARPDGLTRSVLTNLAYQIQF